MRMVNPFKPTTLGKRRASPSPPRPRETLDSQQQNQILAEKLVEAHALSEQYAERIILFNILVEKFRILQAQCLSIAECNSEVIPAPAIDLPGVFAEQRRPAYVAVGSLEIQADLARINDIVKRMRFVAALFRVRHHETISKFERCRDACKSAKRKNMQTQLIFGAASQNPFLSPGEDVRPVTPHASTPVGAAPPTRGPRSPAPERKRLGVTFGENQTRPF